MAKSAWDLTIDIPTFLVMLRDIDVVYHPAVQDIAELDAQWARQGGVVTAHDMLKQQG
ncbi:MAG: hypothetical protein J5I81_11085 [Nitrococcus mobilis]|nr:hypothetical protein [Nitrococcus mobilis]